MRFLFALKIPDTVEITDTGKITWKKVTKIEVFEDFFRDFEVLFEIFGIDRIILET